MKVLSVVGARPQFVKLRPVAEALAARGLSHFVLHTGQHYDHQMSGSFFSELELPRPDANLGVGSAAHAKQVAEMLLGISAAIEDQRPDFLLIFGDTNSTLAGALAASMAKVPVGHVEAGARSFNRAMPEERNRVVSDAVSDLLLTASPAATTHLEQERAQGRVLFVGDTMLDVVTWARDTAKSKSTILESLELEPKSYTVATIHRAETTDTPATLKAALDLLARVDRVVVLPLHPRTRAAAGRFGFSKLLDAPALRVIEPAGYLDMIQLVQHAEAVMTDSGGLQKEAFYLGVPCVTLRHETEWVETVELGWNHVVGLDLDKARAALNRRGRPTITDNPYGAGDAGIRIVDAIIDFLGQPL
ncbi:MAG: UDP-N-acetylglucosamine 2-epimerase (non-hydrolyzing) [Acidobacteriota bacterium]|nr:UDP-N-acetylglucosamine 2-epimerase (non-hydrolyzing) [Acidobacteriota bacterium]